MELERGLQLLKDEQQRLKSQEENVSHLVESFFGSIEATLQTQKEQLLQELGRHTADINGTLETHIRFAENVQTLISPQLFEAIQGTVQVLILNNPS